MILIIGVYFISRFLPKEKTDKELLETMYKQPSLLDNKIRNLKIWIIMNNTEHLIIYLDIFAFLLLLAFFILLFKSSSLFINNKNNGRL